MKDEEEMFTGVFGESVEETLRENETSEETNKTRARFTDTALGAKEVEDHSLDYSVFRSWHPHCVKWSAEACGRRSDTENERGAGRGNRLHVHAQ